MPGDEHCAGELTRAGALLGGSRETRHRVGFSRVQEESDGARGLRRVEQLDPGIGVSADPHETDVVGAREQRRLILGCGEAEADGAARQARDVHPHLGRVAKSGIPRCGAKNVEQHISPRNGVDGRRGPNEVDPKLLVRLGSVVGQG